MRATASLIAIVLVVATAVVGTPNAGADLTAPPATTKLSIYYIVSPHPDDEYEGWAAFSAYTPVVYPIFITLTQGEHTTGCRTVNEQKGLSSTNTVWLEESEGELPPSPDPIGFVGMQQCKDARVNSHGGFLGEYAQSVDPFLQGGAPYAGTKSTAVGPARVYAGANYGRILFDTGDGNLSTSEVVSAIGAVNQFRNQYFPNLPLSRVVGASYSNAVAPNSDIPRIPGCFGYAHADHYVAYHALMATVVAGVEHHVRTCSLDLAATYTAPVAADHHEAAYGVPGVNNAMRFGAGQRYYGWLTDGAWPAPELDTQVVCPVVQTGVECHMFSRFQSFVVR